MICTLLRKPLNGGGGILSALPCGSINIDGSRIGTTGGTKRSDPNAPFALGMGTWNGWRTGHKVISLDVGRYPANTLWLMSGGPEVFLDLYFAP